ncbi:hypothetical protein [Nocardia sp. NPDC019395]|uniref:hypothetical protein n=1 Tax=Nocardia sp. NPDC019395 TaxID=3154686 RepID=UPI0034065CC4
MTETVDPRLTTAAAQRRILGDDLLARLHSRAADYDRENRFFAEDLEDLREAGYLRANRDVRAGAFHPPNSDAARDYIGKFALGLL